MLRVLPRAGVVQAARRRAGQPAGIVEFTIGQESGITHFGKKGAETLGFQGCWRKCHAENRGSSGKCGIDESGPLARARVSLSGGNVLFWLFSVRRRQVLCSQGVNLTPL